MTSLRANLAELQTRRTDLVAALGLAESGASVDASWISGTFVHIARLWPLILLGKLCITALLHVPLYGDGNAGHAVALAAMLLVDGVAIVLPRGARFQLLRPHHQKWLMLPMVLLSGLSFSLMLGPALIAGEPSRNLVAEMAVALMAVSIFGDRRLLGVSYFCGLLIASILHRSDFAQIGLLISCIAAMLVAALRQAQADMNRAIAFHQRDLRAQRSDRLLREYEQSGRGWFWETDRHGCIAYISDTLARTLGLGNEALIGRPITEIIRPGDRQDGDGERTLGFHLSARTGFAEIPVRAAMAKDERWWSISGQPVFNEFGQFHGFRGSGTDLTEMRRSQAEVTRLAQYDSLTGLANRVQMMRSLEQAVAGKKGQPRDCTLMMLDLDRFKIVNDTLGHPAGDALLRQVSERIQRVVGNKGLVGRQGGDEFKILLPGRPDKIMLDHLARAIITDVSQPYMVEGTAVVIGVSIGISFCPQDGVTADELIRNADLALYAAKGDGRGVYRFYSPEMHADAEDRRQLEEDLRRALVENALHLVYQPVVSSRTEQIAGYEALLRWQHPVRGAISPTLFIPIAEESGLIGPIGEWVLRTACRDAAQWADGVRVAVNVSPIQFANQGLPSIVMNALAASGLTAERLELEITESVFLNDDDGTDLMFSRLKGIGVRLALDDFGTGYSSLGYLKKAPFDKIKIDQSFVRGAAIKGSPNSAIIKAIVSLAEALGMDTTAEGAETQDELALIRNLGCSHIQGYVYGRPLPAADVLIQQHGHGGVVTPQGFQSSRTERKTMLRTVAVHHDGHVYTGRIRNISATGAQLEGLWNVPEGTLFTIELGDNQTVNAMARWSRGDRLGVEFVQAIDPSTLRAMPRSMAS
ncbi:MULTISPECIES: EAL domain-containing protein [Sphingobium]|uniref:Diguanylate cyclase n=3 Tax=Sphingobium indicum TaxID=332055 RepID=A0A1L5BPK2_SPHIB|nr:EAL domain-containing protein [Sphingobium indicum]APL94728.1 diguanylate cyclase [Sphingobium indicum B90A]KEZ00006.1 diguanylate cyclase [Sphingomonas sp. BHC-A]NYI22821.1 diguanylate cyclase (GGDEF)-like protein/PAS domain S-box-containing protein [Sphingobium indicum]RYM02079.1 EAL domain-containing protein [Sphingobium indicum]